MKKPLKNLVYCLSFLAIFIVSCVAENNPEVSDLSISEDLVEYEKYYDYPLYIDLYSGKKKVDYFMQYDKDGINIANAKLELGKQELRDFKIDYDLQQYDNILQVYLLLDNSDCYLNSAIDKNEINALLVYHLNKNNIPSLHIIKNKEIIYENSSVSNIYGHIIANVLLSTRKFNKKPLNLLIDNAGLYNGIDIKWSLLSDDILYKSNGLLPNILRGDFPPNTIDEGTGGGRCSSCSPIDKQDTCSNFNPMVCGSICQLRASLAVLTKDGKSSNVQLSNSLFSMFDNLYKTRNILNKSQNGRTLVNDYYDLGTLSFSNQINIPLTDIVKMTSLIVNNLDKINKFNDFPNSNNILYTNAESVTYIDIIDDLLNTSSNTDFQRILTNFKNTIIKFKGKSIKYIHENI